MFRGSKSSISSSSEMGTLTRKGSSPGGTLTSRGTPPMANGSCKTTLGRHSRSSSREATPDITPRNSVQMMDTGELSPLKQFQRMKENGTIRLMPKSRRSTDGNQSDPGDAADRENKKYLRMSMTMNMDDISSHRNSSVCVIGAADLNGAGPSLLKMSSEANIHASRTSLHPADSSSNVSTCTEMSISSNASSSISRPSTASASSSSLHYQQLPCRSKEPKDILLSQLGGDPVYGTRPITPVITAAEHPVSRRKPPMGARQSCTLPIEKPVIDVKLVRNDRPRSSYRMSKSVEELDKPDDDKPKQLFLRHAGSNLRNSFIDRNRDSMSHVLDKNRNSLSPTDMNRRSVSPIDTKSRETLCNSVNDILQATDNNTLKVPGPEEIYSLPQPASYSEETLKAVKKITEKYDTLQMRKMRALSFRENNKSTSIESNTSATPSDEKNEAEATCSSQTSPSEQSDRQSQDTLTDQSGEESLNHSTDTLKESPLHELPPPPRRSKPPLPPMPPPSKRTGPTGRLVDVPPHLAVVDPDAAEDSDFMIQANDQKVKKQGSENQALWNSEGDEVVCVSSGITQKDISRIDLFFRSRECEVVVCQCLADMTTGSANPATGVVESWSAVCHTGVPVLVLNTGLGKRRRELFVILAERETGFPLWQDRVNYLTNYKDIKTAMHQLQPSTNLRMRVGFRFYCTNAAAEFHSKYREMTTDPNDDLWKVANTRLDKNRRAILKKLRLKKRPTKGDISQPCNFSHVTKLDTKDYAHYESINDLVPKSPINSGSASKTGPFRPRLQTT